MLDLIDKRLATCRGGSLALDVGVVGEVDGVERLESQFKGPIALGLRFQHDQESSQRFLAVHVSVKPSYCGMSSADLVALLVTPAVGHPTA